MPPFWQHALIISFTESMNIHLLLTHQIPVAFSDPSNLRCESLNSPFPNIFPLVTPGEMRSSWVRHQHVRGPPRMLLSLGHLTVRDQQSDFYSTSLSQNENWVVMMPTSLSLVAPKVVIMTATSKASDDKDGVMTTLSCSCFHCLRDQLCTVYPINVLMILLCFVLLRFPDGLMWSYHPYFSGLLLWYWGNHMIAPVPVE